LKWQNHDSSGNDAEHPAIALQRALTGYLNKEEKSEEQTACQRSHNR
jgi:hypothetical protein